MIFSTPNQLFSTFDLIIFTNRPRYNLANLYPTSHGRFLPNFMRFVPTVSRTSGTNSILSPNPTLIIVHIGNGYLHKCHKYNSNDANARLYFNYVLKIPDNVLVHFYFFLFSIQLDGCHPYDTLSIVLISNFPKQTSETNCTLS